MIKRYNILSSIAERSQMKYDRELIRAKVIGRYNGVIIDANTETGENVAVFCSALDVVQMCTPNTTIYISKNINQSRHVKWILVFVEQEQSLIYACPNNNNDLFQEAFWAGLLPEFSEYTECRKLEAEDNLSHIDFELSKANGEKAYIFVTNVYHKIGDKAVFPMEVNFFELEMFEEMNQLQAAGHNTYAVMIVPRQDCSQMQFSWKHSPLAAAKLFEEAKKGLKFIGYGCKIDKKSVSISQSIPILY